MRRFLPLALALAALVALVGAATASFPWQFPL